MSKTHFPGQNQTTLCGTRSTATIITRGQPECVTCLRIVREAGGLAPALEHQAKRDAKLGIS